MSGFVVWFTGLSGAGKSTLAAMLAAELRHRGVHVEVLDGDEVRTHLSKGLGFSREDRDTNVRRIGFVAKLVARSGACAITAAISPYRAIRDEQRARIPGFFEVHVRCAIPVLAERDAKGLYKKALAGEIKHFTGIDDPYEEPEQPEVVVDTGVETREESLSHILARLEALGHIGRGARRPSAGGLVPPHGGELVDRVAPEDRREALAEEVRALVAIDLDERAERDLGMIASGAFSPLAGFMGQKDHLRVVREMRLENGVPWPVPITLSAPADRAPAIGSRAALRARDGRLVGVIEIADRWPSDDAGTVNLGGEVTAIEPPPPRSRRHDPRATRAIFAARGWSRVVAYEPRGPMLRAHEHLTRSALEMADGLLIHPAFDDEIYLGCIEALVDHRYVKDRVLLSISPARSRGDDPRALLLAALVQKNHGVSHVIVERDRWPTAEGTFGAFSPGELGVTPLFFDVPFWSAVTGSMATERTAPGDASTRLAIDEDVVLEMIARGEAPPEEVVRPEVLAILSRARRA